MNDAVLSKNTRESGIFLLQNSVKPTMSIVIAGAPSITIDTILCMITFISRRLAQSLLPLVFPCNDTVFSTSSLVTLPFENRANKRKYPEKTQISVASFS
jgi:hypothetical protein